VAIALIAEITNGVYTRVGGIMLTFFVALFATANVSGRSLLTVDGTLTVAGHRSRCRWVRIRRRIGVFPIAGKDDNVGGARQRDRWTHHKRRSAVDAERPLGRWAGMGCQDGYVRFHPCASAHLRSLDVFHPRLRLLRDHLPFHSRVLWTDLRPDR
jgi:hypothetical protein